MPLVLRSVAAWHQNEQFTLPTNGSFNMDAIKGKQRVSARGTR
jgi:hypothetical protein